MLKKVISFIQSSINIKKDELISLSQIPITLARYIELDSIKLSKQTKIHFFDEFKLTIKTQEGLLIDDVKSLASKTGGSFRLFNFGESSDVIKYMTDVFSLVFHTNCNANLYFTPSSSQSLDEHQDRYSVFVLQVRGEKEWNIDGQVFTTKPGQYFLLPVGRPHFARAVTDSFHISFSLKMPSIFDFLNLYAYSKNEQQDFKMGECLGDFDEGISLASSVLEKIKNDNSLLREVDGLAINNSAIVRQGMVNTYAKLGRIDLKLRYGLNIQSIVSCLKVEDYLEVSLLNSQIKIKNESLITLFEKLLYLTDESLSEMLRGSTDSKGLRFIYELNSKGLLKRH